MPNAPIARNAIVPTRRSICRTASAIATIAAPTPGAARTLRSLLRAVDAGSDGQLREVVSETTGADLVEVEIRRASERGSASLVVADPAGTNLFGCVGCRSVKRRRTGWWRRLRDQGRWAKNRVAAIKASSMIRKRIL